MMQAKMTPPTPPIRERSADELKRLITEISCAISALFAERELTINEGTMILQWMLARIAYTEAANGERLRGDMTPLAVVIDGMTQTLEHIERIERKGLIPLA